MIVTSLRVDRESFEDETGWKLRPEGACKGSLCVPWSSALESSLFVDKSDDLDLRPIAEHLGMPIVESPEQGLFAVGPESLPSGRALASVEDVDFTLPDLEGRDFALSSLRGQKVVVYAWAPY